MKRRRHVSPRPERKNRVTSKQTTSVSHTAEVDIAKFVPLDRSETLAILALIANDVKSSARRLESLLHVLEADWKQFEKTPQLSNEPPRSVSRMWQ